MENYTHVIKYNIEGVYGNIEYYKKTNDYKDMEDYSKYIIINENGSELYYFYVECYELEANESKTMNLIETSKIVKGLPIGITEDIYFKMALLKANRFK